MAHFRSDVLPQAGVVAELLRLDAPNRPLGLGDELIELLVATDVELAKAGKELGEILHHAVPEDLRLAILWPLNLSVKWLTSLANSAVNASSANCTASSKRFCTRRHSSSYNVGLSCCR